jgi:molybdopterin/thiamine biosynthesis adenylyltransferase
MGNEKELQEEFLRNLGLVSEQEQRKLFATRVAVAGAGGVGGLHIITLARLGIGKFIIADPDTFEAVNVNRQFGAVQSTLGRNKAEVLAEMVRDINPDADVNVFTEGVNGKNIDAFLDGADLFIDGIDFFEIAIRRLLFSKSREKGIYALTAAPLGFGATLQVFSPSGMSFDDYFGITDGMEELEKIAAFAVGLAPHPYHLKYLDLSKVNLSQKTGPAVSPACTLAASLIATEVVKILTGKGKIRPVPCYTQFDLLRGKFKQGTVSMGGKNPIQHLKKWFLLRKAKAAESSSL